MSKIIFLDVDGVLNSSGYYVINKDNLKYTGDSSDLEEYRIQLLHYLVKETNSKIVMSSEWRTSVTIPEFRKLFSDKYKPFSEVAGNIIGSTPKINKLFSRGNEIQSWLDRNSEKFVEMFGSLTSYVILDDFNALLDHQLKYFVHINNVNGLVFSNVQDAIKILNTDNLSGVSDIVT